MTLFDSLWFVCVTFSTVGYGDIFPEAVGGRLVVIGAVVAAYPMLTTPKE